MSEYRRPNWNEGIKKYSESERTPEFKAAREAIQEQIARAAEYVGEYLPPSWHVRKETGRVEATRRLLDDSGDAELFYDRMIATAGIDSSFKDAVAKFCVDRGPSKNTDREIDTFGIEVHADGSVHTTFEGEDSRGNQGYERKELHDVEQLELASGILDVELEALDIVH